MYHGSLLLTFTVATWHRRSTDQHAQHPSLRSKPLGGLLQPGLPAGCPAGAALRARAAARAQRNEAGARAALVPRLQPVPVRRGPRACALLAQGPRAFRPGPGGGAGARASRRRPRARPRRPPTGRLLRYDPRDGSTRVVAERFWFANGVALAPGAAWAAVVETNSFRVLSVQLTGPTVRPRVRVRASRRP